MNKLIIFLFMCIILISSVNAWGANNFNNSLTSSFENGYDNGWTVTNGFNQVERNNSWASDRNWNVRFNADLGDVLSNSNVNLSYYHYLVVDYNVSSVNEGMKAQVCDSCYSGCTNINEPSTYIYGVETGTKLINLSSFSGNKCVVLATGYTFGGGNSFNFIQLDNVRLMTDSDYQAVFTGNQNITRYLSVPSNTLLTNAFLNLSGLVNQTYYYQSAGLSTQVDCSDPDWSASYPCARINNGDSGTQRAQANSGTIAVGYFNWTKPSNAIAANNTLSIKLYGTIAMPTNTYSINATCFNQNTHAFKFTYDYTTGFVSDAFVDIDCYDGSWVRIVRINTDGFGGYIEGIIEFTNNYNYTNISQPSNISLSIGNNQGFNQSGLFNITNRTSNLAGLINNYLSTCTFLNGFCLVPLIFHSDSTGSIVYNNLIFDNEGYVNNGEIYNSNTYETTTESFALNITFDPNYYQSATASLIYNGSTYTSVKSTNGIYTIFNSTINIPLINVTSLNNSFYWSVALANSSGNTYFNTTVHNQTVNQINFGVCNGTTNTLALNITAYNQDDLSSINNWNFKGVLNYYISNSSLSKVFNLTNLSIVEQNLCINVNTTFRITGQLEYSVNNSYQTSNYYFVNENISNSVTNLRLGLLPITSTTVFIVKLLDQYNLPVNGYYINIDRFYPGLNEYRTVQTLKTDSNGQSVGFIEINNVQYRFVVKDPNGNIVYTSDTRVITPQSSPYTITINLVSSNPNILNTNRTIEGLTWSISFDKNSKIVTYAYADSNSSFTKSELIVFQTTGNSNTIICATNLTTPNGVITCNLSNYTSGSFSAQVYVYRDVRYFVDNLLFDISNLDFGNLGILGGIFIIMICAFMFSFNELAGIFSVNVGIIAVNLLGLINFGWITISSIIAISIVIAIVLERS